LDPGRTDPVAGPSASVGAIALARIVLRSPVDLAGFVVPSATPPTRRRIGERLDVRAQIGAGWFASRMSIGVRVGVIE